MNPDLRAIEATILGEPHDPSNLSPEAASVILPLVRRVVQERDDGQHEIDMLRRERHAERQRVSDRDQTISRLRADIQLNAEVYDRVFNRKDAEHRAAVEEARLTLAAEQGKPEGAPSAGWEFDGRDWFKNYPDGSFAGLSGRRGKRRWMRALWPDTERAPTYLGRGLDVETDRAAMKCADAAHPSTPPASPE